MLNKVVVTTVLAFAGVALLGGKAEQRKAKTLAKTPQSALMQPTSPARTPTVEDRRSGFDTAQEGLLYPTSKDAGGVTRLPVANGPLDAGLNTQLPTRAGEFQPQPVAQAAHLPAAGGFCTTGNCGPAAALRRVVVQRAGIFRGRIFRGRR
jgi:hypothetical protein